MSSVDSLLHHPLVVALDYKPGDDIRRSKWTCRTRLPERGFVFQDKPIRASRQSTSLDEADIAALACGWLRRRGVDVHCSMLGLVHPSEGKIWAVDIVGERKKQAVIAATYFSNKRKGRARSRMREYTARLRDVCHSIYKVRNPVTAVINVYGAGRVEGEFL